MTYALINGTMSVKAYRMQLLSLNDCDLVFDIPTAQQIIRAWRAKVSFEWQCHCCQHPFNFSQVNFYVCCKTLHFNPSSTYIVKSIAVTTPGISILSSYLKNKSAVEPKQQEFLILPDPIYWQLETTLIYDTVLVALSNPANQTKVAKLYTRIQNAPLYHCSLSYRTQGKESFYRKIAIAKRCEQTARAMIVPAPDLKPNEVVLPEAMKVIDGILGRWVIINRMPSLSTENFVALRVVKFWKGSCVGLGCATLKYLGADFDGDEVNILFLSSDAAQSECEWILNSQQNMYSFSNHLKLYPSQDALVAYYLDRSPVDYALRGREHQYSLIDFLRMVYELEGSESCFDWFDRMRQHYLTLLEEEVSFSICFEEFEYLQRMARHCKDAEEFEQKLRNDPHEEMCLEVQIKSGAKGNYIYLYQLVGSVGRQKLGNDLTPSIQSSFLKGLTPEEYCVHAMSGHEALIESLVGVWKPGYNYFKLVNNVQNITVDYQGRLMDDNQVLCDDALEDVYFEDVLSTQTFDYLFNMYFGENE